MLGVILLTLVVRSKSVAWPGAHRERYVGDRPSVALPQKDSEGGFTAHLLCIKTHERCLFGFVQHELVGRCRSCAPRHLVDVGTKCCMINLYHWSALDLLPRGLFLFDPFPSFSHFFAPIKSFLINSQSKSIQ